MQILLAKPRGFCAGVERAIGIVERAIEKFGKPIYVRHEIVHNKAVCQRLRDKGAIFIEELSEAPTGSIAVFSAHGVPQVVLQEAETRNLVAVDATCPLVKKVHTSVKKHAENETTILLIGHRGHPEVVGTMGQLDPGRVILVESPEDVAKLNIPIDQPLAFTTQTTLSIDETRDVITALKSRFPNIKGPEKGDLCYATTNRQTAIAQIAEKSDLILVVGSKNSSNSNRLRELGEKVGKPSYLVDCAQDLQLPWFDNVNVVGISSGASAPEDLVQEVVEWICTNFTNSSVSDHVVLEENVHFSLPDLLKN